MARIIGRILMGLGGAVAVLLAVLAFNTWRYTAEIRTDVAPFSLGADVAKASDLLAQAIRIKTVSTKPDTPGFDAFVPFLETSFPAVHGAMTRDLLDMRTPLYRWQGRDASLPPVLLAAHYDVVPVAPWSLDRWTHPPYDGVVDDTFVWGRGTLDNKGALIAILSAAEHLITQGFTPERTIYLSFGGDEEVGGQGAQAVAQHFMERGVLLDWTLDEGSFVLKDVIPGLTAPVASINLSEKGYVTLKLVAEAAGGHSALPPPMTAVGRIARAVDRVQKAPLAGGLDGVTGSFFDALGRHFTLGKRVLFANTWLFGPLLKAELGKAPSTNAMLRTTTAPTMLTGSIKSNVLPTEATATINFRLHPRDSVEDVVAHVTAAIDDPEIRIEIEGSTAMNASPVARVDAQGFKDIESSILAVFGQIASVPGLTIAATDARHYARASKAAYRINPFMVDPTDIARFHGTNERLSIENLGRGIDFYGALMQKQ